MSPAGMGGRFEPAWTPHPAHAAVAAGLLHAVMLWRRGGGDLDLMCAAAAWLLAAGLLGPGGTGRGAGADWTAFFGCLLLVWGSWQTARLESSDLPGASLLRWVFAAGVFCVWLPAARGLAGGTLFAVTARFAALVFLAGVFPVRLAETADSSGWLSVFHAQLGGFLLHYLGFPVSLDGARVTVGGSAVEVFTLCTGAPLAAGLLVLAALIILAARPGLGQAALLTAGAMACGLGLGVVRVALLAWANFSHPALFAWLHGPGGNSLFAALALLAFYAVLVPFEGRILGLFKGWPLAPSKGPALGARWTAIVVPALAALAGLADPQFAWRAGPATPPPPHAAPANVPDTLGARRYDRVAAAWRLDGGPMVLRIENALSAPGPLIAQKEIRLWLGTVSVKEATWEVSSAVRPSGETFRSEEEWNALLRQDIRRPGRWLQWVITGTPVKIRTYDVRIAETESPPEEL